jgi:uncharacterized membrane protein
MNLLEANTQQTKTSKCNNGRIMNNEISTTVTPNETGRIEASSDGVFAIAITLLILEIKAPSPEQIRSGLVEALLEKWSNYLAIFIRFFTILVYWINHHYIFDQLKKPSHSLLLVNSLTLFVVTFVPFPTGILSEAFKGGDLQTAVQLFGLAFILMASCYTALSMFIYNDKGIDYTQEQLNYKKGIRRMYSISIIHTIITFFVAYVSVTASILLYIALFSMYLFPVWYTNLIIKLQGNKVDNQILF